MKNIYKYAFMAVLSLSLVNCSNGDDYGTPASLKDCVTWETNTSINDLHNARTDAFYSPTKDSIFEGYVVSSDEGGNFYKLISLVSLDNTKGMSIAVDEYNLYTKFEPGRKVFINLKNMDFQKAGSFTVGLNAGQVYESTSGPRIGRIPMVYLKEVMVASCDKVNEERLVKHLTINEAKNDAYLNQLIEFDAVQFADSSLGTTYFSAEMSGASASATDHRITDRSGSELIVRVSSYSKFAKDAIPTGSGKVRGVMTKYNGNYQFMLRTIEDVKITDGRIDETVYLNSVNETFESFAVNNAVFVDYKNQPIQGGRTWQVKSFSNNKYIQLNAFANNAVVPAHTYFAIPVNFDTVSTLEFSSLFGFDNGNPIKVYYTNDFIPGNLASANKVDITSNFTFVAGPSTTYASVFTPSGLYTFPTSLSGNGYVIFEYNNIDQPTISSTVQLDNIKIQ